MLESKNLTKKYGAKTAVDDISLQILPGKIYAMLGPNGSGKTTWMKMAAGLVKPTSGTLTYNGAPVGVASRREIAYMSTEPYFYPWMNIGDVGKYYQDFFKDFDMVKYHTLLSRMELTTDLKTKALSSGMMAKLKIAVTMARHAKIIMLDEPFNGIDLIARDAIAKTILETISEDTSLLVSSHMVEELETLADSAIFIKNGKLIEACSLDELREKHGTSIIERYREIYGNGGMN